MTEKRADYRKRQSKKSTKKFFNHVKSAFDDDSYNNEKVDVNPDFRRHKDEQNNFQERFNNQDIDGANIDDNNLENKSLRLKKRLNRAILIVFVLIIIVLLALFHL